MALDGKIRFHDHPSALVHRAAGGIAQHLAQVGGPNARCPADRGGLQGVAAVRGVHYQLAFADLLHPAPEQELNASFLEIALGRLGDGRIHGAQHPIARIHQGDLALLGIQLFEIPFQAVAHEFIEGSRQFASRGPATNHHHRLKEEALGWIGSLFGFLEG